MTKEIVQGEIENKSIKSNVFANQQGVYINNIHKRRRHMFCDNSTIKEKYLDSRQIANMYFLRFQTSSHMKVKRHVPLLRYDMRICDNKCV